MNNEQKNVPFIAHESIVACLERSIRRLWILCILLVILLVATNGAWIWYNSQFEYFTVTQENEDGYNNFIGNDGEITNNGKADSKW